jgi:molybdate/tungstate transport system permease protein
MIPCRWSLLSVAFALLGTLLMLFILLPILGMAFHASTLSPPAPESGTSWRVPGAAEAAEAWSAFQEREVRRALLRTLQLALVAASLSVLFGVPLAYLLARRQFPGKPLVSALVDLPVIVPHPVAGLALHTIFARKHLMGSLLEKNFGLAVVDSSLGIVLAMLFVSASFTVNTARDGFLKIHPRLENVARSLGASDFRVFFTISFPLAARSILTGFVLAWSRAISEFGSIVILAATPKTASVLIWDRFTTYGTSAALPVATLLLLVCLVTFALFHLLLRKGVADHAAG